MVLVGNVSVGVGGSRHQLHVHLLLGLRCVLVRLGHGIVLVRHQQRVAVVRLRVVVHDRRSGACTSRRRRSHGRIVH